jgi:hypothetical protein
MSVTQWLAVQHQGGSSFGHLLLIYIAGLLCRALLDVLFRVNQRFFGVAVALFGVIAITLGVGREFAELLPTRA